MSALAIDLFSGLGGWAEGLEAEGWDVIRVDLFDMFAQTGTPKPSRCLLMLQDVMTFHGVQAKGADLIVASPPCQEFSYMAMPWSLAKAKAAAIRADETGEAFKKLTALFNACFRIQREACEAAGRHIPMVVENVRGAQEWVGKARANFGSYYLWGDVPALMPQPCDARKNPGFRFDGSGRSFQSESVSRHVGDGRKGAGAGAGAGAAWFDGNLCVKSSKSSARKAASAEIAKIPFGLSTHIARVYRPASASSQAPA
jgi:hypothetical protein